MDTSSLISILQDSLLHITAWRCYAELVMVLIREGADLDIGDDVSDLAMAR